MNGNEETQRREKINKRLNRAPCVLTHACWPIFDFGNYFGCASLSPPPECAPRMLRSRIFFFFDRKKCVTRIQLHQRCAAVWLEELRKIKIHIREIFRLIDDSGAAQKKAQFVNDVAEKTKAKLQMRTSSTVPHARHKWVAVYFAISRISSGFLLCHPHAPARAQRRIQTAQQITSSSMYFQLRLHNSVSLIQGGREKTFIGVERSRGNLLHLASCAPIGVAEWSAQIEVNLKCIWTILKPAWRRSRHRSNQ
jgi:hypothetical protein